MMIWVEGCCPSCHLGGGIMSMEFFVLHSTRQRYGCRLTISPPIDHLGLDEEVGLCESCLDKASPIPDACLELVTCGRKSKYRTARCTYLSKRTLSALMPAEVTRWTAATQLAKRLINRYIRQSFPILLHPSWLGTSHGCKMHIATSE